MKRLVEHRDISRGQTRHFKRPRIVGIGIHQVEDGFTTLNRVDVVTGDINYTPRCGFNWKGETTITSSNLERMRAEKVVQIRSTTTADNQSQTSSSRKTCAIENQALFY
ncbi:hypothetical protein H5410_022166 [Solanum commersonii]|uniref:Uncharacterized protein n=1 Tax=Solanum commersonii TaxID=4109 RepID=A0A9J5ZEM8_SOLCO|nr:hypothetical protein H5410_022166 [Solanum commersonii]